MKKLVSLVLLISLIFPVWGEEKSKPKEKPKEIEEPIEISRDKYHRVIQINKNTVRLTTNWVFVVDNSHSTWKIASRILTGFRTAIQFPTDELRFCTYVFHNKGCHKYRDWKFASPGEFLKTEQFIKDNRGVSSYAALAIQDALRQPIKELTVIIISDGGFSDGEDRAGSTKNFKVIEQIIAKNQQWRINRKLGQAVIVAIGIENYLCWPKYPKETNAQCMKNMKEIGLKGQGGFFYVQPIESQHGLEAMKNGH